MAGLLDLVKGFEGYSAKPVWDYKQWSSGYGTRARPGEVADRAEHERRLNAELGKARSSVTSRWPQLPAHQADALSSFTYNLGPGWMQGSGLSRALDGGNAAEAARRMQQYINAGGKPLPGLVKRRAAEASLFMGGQPVASMPSETGGSTMAQGTAGMTPSAVETYRQRAKRLAANGANGQPMGHWTQALAGALSTGLGGYYEGQADQGETAGLGSGNAALAAALSGNAPTSEVAQTLLQNPWTAEQGQSLALRELGREPADPLDRQLKLAQLQKLQRGETSEYQQRAAAAQQYGLEQGSPEFQQFILTGKIPGGDGMSAYQSGQLGISQQRLEMDREKAERDAAGGGVELTAVDKKAIIEADELAQSSSAAMQGLDRALMLHDKAYSGFMANERGAVMGAFGGEAGAATQELNNVITGQALESLKAIFGGMPTEGERKILMEIQGSAEQPRAVREEVLRRARRLAEVRMRFNQTRSQQLRSGDYYQANRPQVQMEGSGPAPGTIEEGFEFVGGNPADPNSWRQVQ